MDKKTTNWKAILEKDDRVKAFRQATKSGQFSIDTTKRVEELEQLHSTRKIRSLQRKDLIQAQKNLSEVLLQNQSYRSRAVEIKEECFKTSFSLDEYLKKLRQYIKSQHAEMLKKVFSTVGEREAVLDNLLEDGIALKSNLQMVQAIADMIIDDLDKAYWTVKGIINVLEIGTKLREI